jgi:hypothetical protein
MRLVRFLVYALGGPCRPLSARGHSLRDGLIDDTMEVKFDRHDPSIVADCGNGLNAAQRASFHYVSHGYEITPRPASGGEVYFALAMEGPGIRREAAVPWRDPVALLSALKRHSPDHAEQAHRREAGPSRSTG